MQIQIADRISKLSFYAFAEVDRMVTQLKKQGIEPIDFGVGDPIDPTPETIREACQRAVDKRKSAGYPSYIGTAEFRQEVANWTKKRFGVDLDPETEITSTAGSKEAVFHFPLAFINPGDVVISPNPGYPPYERGTSFAGGENYFLPLLPENNFLPDLNSIPTDITKRAKILWINYPSNPCAVDAPKEFYRKAIDFCKKNNIILVSDECYTEIYFDDTKKPHSILEFVEKSDPVVSIVSLSKRSNMTCYRVGWATGNKDIIDAFKKIKTNIDSGTPTFIQDAAIAALKDESHVREQCRRYHDKKEILNKTFENLDWPQCMPKTTFYIWQQIPNGFKDSVEFAKKLLEPEIAVVVTPGQWISHTIDGINPGEKFVRFALVPNIDQVRKAAERIEKAFG